MAEERMAEEINLATAETLHDIQMQCLRLETPEAKEEAVYNGCVTLGAAVCRIKYGKDAASGLSKEERFSIGARILSDEWKFDVEEWLKGE